MKFGSVYEYAIYNYLWHRNYLVNGLSFNELCRSLNLVFKISRPTVLTALKGLVKCGLVDRARAEVGQRVYYYLSIGGFNDYFRNV